MHTDKLSDATEKSPRALQHSERVASLRLPSFVSRLLPMAFKQMLHEAVRRMLVKGVIRDLTRDAEYEQSPVDAHASSHISVIVAIHDAPEVTARCLASLERYAPEAEVILVDDASKLEQTAKVLKDFSTRNGWVLVRNETSLSHSGANAVGSKLATKPYLCLLNSDTVVTPWCWLPIVKAFEENVEIGAAGPSTSASGNEQTIQLMRSIRHDLNDNQINEYANRLRGESAAPIIADVLMVSGFALFIRKGVWESLGGFDKNLPDYGNDIDLSKRVVDLGYRAVWVRNSYIHHLQSVSYSKLIGLSKIFARQEVAASYIEKKSVGDQQ